MRSLETRVQWYQQAVRRGLVELETFSSDDWLDELETVSYGDNLADLGTKTLRVDRLKRMRIGCGIAPLLAPPLPTWLMLWRLK